MKAYMSDPHPGFIIPDRHDMPAEHFGMSGAMAMDEARAILAETEPSIPGTVSLPFGSRFHCESTDILAESLAAFVGMDSDAHSGLIEEWHTGNCTTECHCPESLSAFLEG